MIRGHVRDGFPYVTLALPGSEADVNVEFVVDTAFEGDLALPSSTIRFLAATFYMRESFRMADGSQLPRPVYNIILNWNGEERVTYILALDGGVPLLGTGILSDHSLYCEIVDGGEVAIDPL